MRKYAIVILNQLNIKKIKSIKIILEKIIKKQKEKKIITKKNHVGYTLAINGVLKKKTTKLNFQPAQYEKNKFDKDNFWKKIDKKSCGETL